MYVLQRRWHLVTERVRSFESPGALFHTLQSLRTLSKSL